MNKNIKKALIALSIIAAVGGFYAINKTLPQTPAKDSAAAVVLAGNTESSTNEVRVDVNLPTIEKIKQDCPDLYLKYNPNNSTIERETGIFDTGGYTYGVYMTLVKGDPKTSVFIFQKTADGWLSEKQCLIK